LDLSDISSRTSNEFEANAEEVTRNIATLNLSTLNEPESVEYQSRYQGAGFEAHAGLFKSSQSSSATHAQSAPPLPFFLQPPRTSYRSNKTLEVLKSELEVAFSECSVAFTLGEKSCRYSCSALHTLTLIHLDVNIFYSEDSLLVEIHHISGCRYAFGEISDLLAASLNVKFADSSSAVPLAPPPIPDSLPDLPVLNRASSSELKCNEEVCNCDYAMELLNSPTRSTILQGLRATGALVATLAAAMESCTHCGACGAHHYHHEKLFAEGGHWVPLANRIGELSQNDDDEIRTVAMGVVANISALKNVCCKWLESTIPTLVAGVADDLPHLRREAMRSVEAVATHDKKLAAKLVRSGVVPSLELEANGGEEDQSPDMAMQSLAQGALQACRAEA